MGFIDITPFGFLAMGIILMIGVFNNNLFDIRPLALNSLFDSIPDAIFVFNLQNEIINTNPSAKKLLDNNDGYLNETLVELVNQTRTTDDEPEANAEKEVIIGNNTFTIYVN